MHIHDVRRLIQTLVLVLLGAWGSEAAVGADCVSPSSDVVTGTMLRAGPTTQSTRLGTLRPGESLPFLGSQASWYQVQQAGGSSAFVSKRWTQIASCPPGEETGASLSHTPAGPAVSPVVAATGGGPTPLLSKDHPVEWWFVFKFNSVAFPGCGAGAAHPASCPFGGSPKSYSDGQQFVFASSESPTLKAGAGCAGTSEEDPIGATYDEIYNGRLHYAVWNDQFKGDPNVSGCGANCNSPWGHSKGLVAWDDSGYGIVMQVTTPSWPGSGNQEHPRQSDGNTLGCVTDDNVMFSQHFFALQLTEEDLVKVLRALKNASVGTDPGDVQIVSNGGPADVQALVAALGHQPSSSKEPTIDMLSSGVRVISKPSALQVPPWQLVSGLLGSVPLRVASWWTHPAINSTTATTSIDCWNGSLVKPGAVDIATSGSWEGTDFGLKGGTPNGNHAKIGVSTDGGSSLAIFGDMNQQGALSGNCGSSQNGRGGLFFVVQDSDLAASITSLIAGSSAPAN